MTITPASALGAPSMFDVSAWVETKCDSKAVRFEPAIYSKLLLNRSDSQKSIVARIQTANGCSWNTALMIYSASWGAVQLMGFNLYGPAIAYPGSLFDYAENPLDQQRTYARFLTSLGYSDLSPIAMAADATLRHNFAIRYNGAPSYADLISQSLEHFGIAVKG